MPRNPKQPDPKRAAAIRAGLARRRALGGKLGRAFQYTSEQAAQVVRLREQGLSWSGISTEMSIPISTARTLHTRGAKDMSQSHVSNMPKGRQALPVEGLSLSPSALTSLSAHAPAGLPDGDAPDSVSTSASDSVLISALSCVLNSAPGLTASGEALLSMLIAHEPRLDLPENQDRTRRLLSIILDLPPSGDAESELPECPDPRQRVWTLSEINAVRRLLSDGMAQLKIAKTVNASPNDISAIKQDRIDRVRGGYIVHRTKAKMQRYRASLSR